METQSGPGSPGEDASKEPKQAVWGHLARGVPTLLLPLLHHCTCPCSLWARLPLALPSQSQQLCVQLLLSLGASAPASLHRFLLNGFGEERQKKGLIKLSPVLTWYRLKPVQVTLVPASIPAHAQGQPGTDKTAWKPSFGISPLRVPGSHESPPS